MIIPIKYKYFFLYFVIIISLVFILQYTIYKKLSDEVHENLLISYSEISEKFNSVLQLTDNLFLTNDVSSTDLVILNSLSDSIFGNDSNVLIFNSNNEIVFTTNDHLASQRLHHQALINNDEKGYYTLEYLGVERVFIYSYNPINDLYFCILTPKDSIMDKSLATKEIMTTLLVTTILIFTVFALLISSRISSPIRQLRDKLQLIENEDFEKVLANHTNKFYLKDEFWQIDLSFKKVVAKLNEYIQKEYDYELKSKETKLLALQSQINPHFLYNALETINSISIVNKVPLITELTQSLAQMFRYNTSPDLIVPVKSEINQVKDYLTVQTIRFNESVSYEFDIQEQIENYETLKFTLQPVVENCFIHAFNNMSDGAFITVSGFQKDEKLIFEIKDNGVGIDEEKMKQLNFDLLHDDGHTTNHAHNSRRIGIFNVNQRLKLHYGNDYGLSLRANQPNGGLIVRLTLPIVEFKSKS